LVSVLDGDDILYAARVPTKRIMTVLALNVRYGPPKSVASRRAVATPPHIIGDLEHHLAMYAQPGAHGLVFVGPKGGRIRRNNFASRVWAPAAEAA
jgi:hypothetical protein